MPVSITLPLTPLEQAVADARANEQVMAAKVEDAKLILKSAKSAWEEAVGEVFRALDEMIADKRTPVQPSLFDEVKEDLTTIIHTYHDDKSHVSPPATDPAADPLAGTVNATVEIIPTAATFTEVTLDAKPLILAAAPPVCVDLPDTTPWRDLIIAEHLDGPGTLFDTLAVFDVNTLGQLADALGRGETFNLKAGQVSELKEAIQDVSQEDEVPVRFEKADDVASEVVKVEGDATQVMESLRKEVAEQPEPKPAKKPRGRKPKQTDKASETTPAVERADTTAVDVTTPAPVEEAEPGPDFSHL